MAMELNVIAYSKKEVSESAECSIAESKALLEKYDTVWLDLHGDLDKETMDQLQAHFNIHPLALEDCLDPNQTPKVEEYDDFVFILFKSIDVVKEELLSHRYNIFLGKKYVITITDQRSELLSDIRKRIRLRQPQIVSLGASYLSYVIIDAIVDSYFPEMEEMGESIDELEEEVLEHPSKDILRKIHDKKRMLIIIRKVLWPHRDLLAVLYRGGVKETNTKAVIFAFRDVYDHMTQILEILETQRDILNAVMVLYQSAVNNNLNEVMKVLTVISTIFIPMTFIGGWYGMNFRYMPELSWRYGYVMVWCILIIMIFTMVIYFWKKRWIGPGSD